MPVSGRRDKKIIIAEAKGYHPYFEIGEVFSFIDPLNGSRIVLEVADTRQFSSGFDCCECKLNSLCHGENADTYTVPECLAGFREDEKDVFFREA